MPGLLVSGHITLSSESSVALWTLVRPLAIVAVYVISPDLFPPKRLAASGTRMPSFFFRSNSHLIERFCEVAFFWVPRSHVSTIG